MQKAECRIDVAHSAFCILHAAFYDPSALRTPQQEPFMSVTPITDRRIYVQPGDVHAVLARHMLADGYEIVMDLRKSKGSWVFDAKRGRNVLDFFTNFADVPIGYNHPRLDNPDFREKLADAAHNKPVKSDHHLD